ncbi:type II toxin-antitoxin system VapC family toxin [Aquiluna borgnonia]|uniref:Ribonuclease VapC n=1 Tax=Aquiluna borgnonia TaxID=2499157 RepID=A0A7D4UK85_9MICO|nr:type II toxin-antitoxin system VapC family toxin [Aquiluna borgnonia]QKJ25779.1 type II toxin-antitoxin system VapC family toxin [Aquiluna borgnonia]
MLLIDTDICSYAIRSRHDIVEKLALAGPENWAISMITHHELLFGSSLPTTSERTITGVRRFLDAAKSLDFDSEAASAAALVRARLREKGKPSGEYDALIAGHAIALDATLVTNNTKHFENVPGLKLESWI